MTTLAERIIEAMDTAGLSVADVATACETSYQAIRKLRIGESHSMDGKTLTKLAKATHFEAEWIISGTGPKHRAYAENEPQTRALLAMQHMPESEQYKIPEVVAVFTQPKRAHN